MPITTAKALSIVAACALLATGTANAASLPPETFTYSNSSTSLNTDGTPRVLFSSDFAPFPAADGTLTSITTTLTGTATWSSSLSSPHLHAVFSPPFFAPQDFTSPGTMLSFNLSGSTSNASILAAFTGTGFRVIDLSLTEETSGMPADTFSPNGNGLSGTITYNFTPTTPLPAALPLFATGLGALGLLGWRRKRKAQAGTW